CGCPFFFQAEDGIRDGHVTGVQTCALPICSGCLRARADYKARVPSHHQALAWLTGPGYFVVHEDRARGAAVDYREIPPERPPNWPEIRPNDRGFSRFVFRDMVDYVRRVARDVFVGSA